MTRDANTHPDPPPQDLPVEQDLPDPPADGGSNNNNEDSETQPLVIEFPKESDFTKRSLPEDTYSFLIYSQVCSRTFILATLVILFQIAVYAVLAYDITTLSNKQNPLNLPVDVEGAAVRIAQVFAIVVALITQDDLHKAFSLLRDGFDEKLPKAFGATKTKWNLSTLLRGIVGLLGLSITFLLIMQAPTVLDLLLNFLAMEFVSLLDDVVFALMGQGFFGRKLQKKAKTLSNTFYHLRRDDDDNVPRSRAVCACCSCCSASCFTFTFLFVTMICAWAIIGAFQEDGLYLCNQIFLQFGDDQLSTLGALSGQYQRDYVSWLDQLFIIFAQLGPDQAVYNDMGRSFGPQDVYGGRVSYRHANLEQGPLLAYCEDEKRWTVSLPKAYEDYPDYYDYDPCDWTVASQESQDTTEDFDVLTTANSEWLVRTTTETERVFTVSQHSISMACYDCFSVPNFCGEYGTCDENRSCLCNPGHYGLRCEYSEKN